MRRSWFAPLVVLSALIRAPLVAEAQQPAVPQGPLTLLQAIALGRSQGVSGAIARLDERAAQARVGQRRAELLPTINGNGAITHQTLNLDEFGIPNAIGVTDPFDIYRLQLQGSQTLFNAAAIGRLRAARDTAVAAGLDARAAGEIAGATAGLAYLQVLSAQETVAAREADSTIAGQLLEQARQLVGAGVSPAIDQTRSEVSFEAVRTQLELARNAADRSRLDLLRTLDLPSGTRIELADSLGSGALDLPLQPDSAASFAREHRAELAAERARTQAAHRSLGAIRAEYLPSLGLTGQYQQSGQQTSTMEGSYAVQLQVTVPILDGFRRQNRVKEENVRVGIQELRERDLVNRVETEARQAVLDVASARQQVGIARQRLRLAEQELAQAQQRFQAGVAGSVETTNAQSSVIAARDAVIQAQVNFGTARVSAYRALGIIDQLH
jgi:outer membrane protein TolC